MEQRTEEWFAARCGKVTASRVADIIAKTKSGPSASRENYLAQLVCERLTGKPAESYSNAAMSWGTEQEEFARAAYEARMDILVTAVGFIDHPWIPLSGASPDGLAVQSGQRCRIADSHQLMRVRHRAALLQCGLGLAQFFFRKS
jgi:hypothetical protein